MAAVLSQIGYDPLLSLGSSRFSQGLRQHAWPFGHGAGGRISDLARPWTASLFLPVNSETVLCLLIRPFEIPWNLF
jgi:hypothetical protein